MDFLERKPQLKKVLNNPFIWQEFVRKELLDKVADDRTVDWIIDPVGNTGNRLLRELMYLKFQQMVS